MTWKKIKELFYLKARYAVGGGVATSIDYLIFFSLVDRFLIPRWAQLVSYSCSVFVNFFFQKKFVFKLKGSTKKALGLSILVSLGGLTISTFLINTLCSYPFFSSNKFFAKLLTSGILFFYNFYLKRYVFERRFF